MADVASPDTTMAPNGGEIPDAYSKPANAKLPRGSSHDSISAWEVQIAALLPRPSTNDGKDVITCLDFGINRNEREAKYPDAFFCGNCIFFVDDYGIAPAGRRKKMFPNGSSYKCTAKHSSFLEPASKKVHFSLLRGSEDKDDNNDDEASRDF